MKTLKRVVLKGIKSIPVFQNHHIDFVAPEVYGSIEDFDKSFEEDLDKHKAAIKFIKSNMQPISLSGDPMPALVDSNADIYLAKFDRYNSLKGCLVPRLKEILDSAFFKANINSTYNIAFGWNEDFFTEANSAYIDIKAINTSHVYRLEVFDTTENHLVALSVFRNKKRISHQRLIRQDGYTHDEIAIIFNQMVSVNSKYL